MKNYAAFAAGLLLSVGLLASCSVQAAPVHYLDVQGVNPIPVTTATPLPVTVSGGGSNAAASATGSAVPANGSYNGVNVGGTLRGQTGTNTSGSVYAADTNVVNQADGADVTQGAKADSACGTATGTCTITALIKYLNTVASSGTANTGSSAPASAIYMGANSAGNLTGVIQADTSAKIDVSTATTTQLVALSSSKKIYVTAWDVIAAGTGNIKLVYGTGSNCGTGTTDLTGNYNLTAQAGISKGSGLGPVIVVPASQALCATTSAAVQMSGSVAYTQF